MRIHRANYVVAGMLAAGALGVGAMLAFLVLPTLQDVLALASGLTDAETQVQAQYANRRQLSDTLSRVKAAQTTVTDLSSQFVHPGDELAVITAIEGIGEKEGVETHFSLTVGSGGIADAKEFDHGFSLTLDGPYPAVLRALVDLERLTQINIIQSFSLRGGSAGSGQAVPVSVSLTGLLASPPKGL